MRVRGMESTIMRATLTLSNKATRVKGVNIQV